MLIQAFEYHSQNTTSNWYRLVANLALDAGLWWGFTTKMYVNIWAYLFSVGITYNDLLQRSNTDMIMKQESSRTKLPSIIWQ